MNALLLAGGKGKRLRPFTVDIPKGMIRIGNVPVLEKNLMLLKEAGIRHVLINLHQNGSVIESYFRDGSHWGLNITYIPEKTLSGTAGVVKKAADTLTGSFLVFYGDNYTDTDLFEMVQTHHQHKSIATIAVFDRIRNPNSGIFGGTLEISPKGYVAQFEESSRYLQRYVNAGIYILQKKILEYFPDKSFLDFGHDVFPTLLENNIPIFTYCLKGFLFGLDNKTCYDRALRYFANTQQR